MSCCTFHENNGDKTLTCNDKAPKWTENNDAIAQTIRAKEEFCISLYKSLLKANTMASDIHDRMVAFDLPAPNLDEQNNLDKIWSGKIQYLIENALERAVYDTYGYGIGQNFDDALVQCAGEPWHSIIRVATENYLETMRIDHIPMSNRGLFVYILGEDYVSRHEQAYLNS